MMSRIMCDHANVLRKPDVRVWSLKYFAAYHRFSLLTAFYVAKG